MKTMFKRLTGRVPLLVVPFLLGIVGCDGSQASVSGEVKYNGQPLPSGTITFIGQGGHNQVVSADVVDGKYQAAAVEPGPVTVTVVSLPPSKGGNPPKGKGIVPPESGHTSKAHMRIPTKYGSPDQSGLTYEVKSGSQTKDFDLPR